MREVKSRQPFAVVEHALHVGHCVCVEVLHTFHFCQSRLVVEPIVTARWAEGVERYVEHHLCRRGYQIVVVISFAPCRFVSSLVQVVHCHCAAAARLLSVLEGERLGDAVILRPCRLPLLGEVACRGVRHGFVNIAGVESHSTYQGRTTGEHHCGFHHLVFADHICCCESVGGIYRDKVFAIAEHIRHIRDFRRIEGCEVKLGQLLATRKHIVHVGDVLSAEIGQVD